MPGISSRLRQARQEAGYRSSVAAAKAHGWPEPAYRHYENGTRNFESGHAEVYGRAFGVSPSWLLGLTDWKKGPANDSQPLIGIPWRPIAELTDALKDGREVLVWNAEYPEPLIARWYAMAGALHTDEGQQVEASHFAEINPPA